MSLVTTLIRSSIGRKYVMAASGWALGLFILVHAAGNASAFLGSFAFNAYSAHLHSLEILLRVPEGVLALFLFIHITIAGVLFFEKINARSRYAVAALDANRLASGTMPYTGVFIVIFLVVHLANFHFGDRSQPLSQLVRGVLAQPWTAGFYLFSLIAFTLHVSHGFWSMLQTFGFNHPKYNRLPRLGSLVVACGVGGVFMLLPILALFSDTFLR